VKIAVSYLKSDNYKKCIEKINESSADFIHVDLCDGKYVQNKNFKISKLVKLLKVAKKPLDVHLMTLKPEKYIKKLVNLNIDSITIHLDATKKPLKLVEYIKSLGIKVGIASNPDESIDALMPYLEKIDKVLVMSVVPGLGGQDFICEVVDKIDALNKLKENKNFLVAVDGGINKNSIKYLQNKNIDIIVSGSYITDSLNYDEQIKSLKEWKNGKKEII